MEVVAKDGRAEEGGLCEELLVQRTGWICVARLLPVIGVELQLRGLHLPRVPVQTGWVGKDSLQSADSQLQMDSVRVPVSRPALLLCQ